MPGKCRLVLTDLMIQLMVNVIIGEDFCIESQWSKLRIHRFIAENIILLTFQLFHKFVHFCFDFYVLLIGIENRNDRVLIM